MIDNIVDSKSASRFHFNVNLSQIYYWIKNILYICYTLGKALRTLRYGVYHTIVPFFKKQLQFIVVAFFLFIHSFNIDFVAIFV
jgi:hypothetical protein